MREVYGESNKCVIDSLLNRVSVLERELIQCSLALRILGIAVSILGIAFIISKLV